MEIQKRKKDLSAIKKRTKLSAYSYRPPYDKKEESLKKSLE